MIELMICLVNSLLNRFSANDEEIEYIEAVKLERVYYTTTSVADMKNYKKPHIGQKFYCEYEDEMYVYVGGHKFVQMANVYI